MIIDVQDKSGPQLADVVDPTVVTAARVHYEKSTPPLNTFTALRTLVLTNWTEPTLDFLQDLVALRYLRVLHLPKVTSLDPINGLINLEVLRLHTLPSWDSSGKKTVVDSLAPIAALPRLRHLELFGVVPRDGSLHQLEGHRTLETARFHKYAKREKERFYQATAFDDSFAPESAEGLA